MMQPAAAETLALKALGHLAENGDALVRFLALSGLDLEDLRQRAADREMLAAVMDFLLSDDSLCAAFLEAEALPAQSLHAARRALPGAHQM
jgi:Protein of unknown function (DUF3572)